MMLGLAITALAVVVILISWIYKRLMEVRFFSQKRFFKARRRAIPARSARAVLHSVFNLVFLHSQADLAHVQAFFGVSFNILSMNHV